MKNVIESAEFEIYYLKKLSYSNYPQVKAIDLIPSTISSKTSKLLSLFPNQLLIQYSIDKLILCKLLEPLKASYESFQTNNKQRKTKNNFLSNHSLTISLSAPLNSLVGIFHHTQYSSVPKHKSQVYFIVNSITYNSFLIDNKSKKKKQFNLNFYKNFSDELDNIKFHHLVVKLMFKQKELIEYMLKNPKLFLLGNTIYNDNIKLKENYNSYTLNQAIIQLEKDTKQEIPTEIARLFYVLINEDVITYYEMIAFIQKYSNDIVSLINKCPTFICSAIMNILKEKKRYKLLNKSQLMPLIIDQMNDENLIQQSENNHYYLDYFCLNITNFTCFAFIKQNQFPNHLMRHYDGLSKQMVYVSFDINNQISYYSYYTIVHYQNIIINGFHIANQNYYFFGYSLKEFQNRMCWFINKSIPIAEKTLMNEPSSSDVQLINKTDFLSSILTPSLPVMSIKDSNIVKRDDGTQVISNYSGRLSLSLSKQIAKILTLDYIPSCYIANIRGMKGTFSTYYNETNNLYYRSPQECYSINADNVFEVKDFSRWKQGYLTYELVSLLYHWRYLSIDLLNETVYHYLDLLTNRETFSSFISVKCVSDIIHKLIQRGISMKPAGDPMLISVYNKIVLSNLEQSLKKGKILFEKSAIVIGIVDEYNILKGNEVFAIISKTNSPDDVNNVFLKGNYLVAKCFPSSFDDVKCMNFIQYNIKELSQNNAFYYQKICKFVNVIVFSSKRAANKDWKINCVGDEEFIIFWDERLLLQNKNKAGKPSLNNNRESIKEVDQKEINGRTIDILISNFISNNFIMTLADNILIKSIENTKIKKTPHFLSGLDSNSSNGIYHSHSILGKYYDLIYERFTQLKKEEEEWINTIKSTKKSIDYKLLHHNILNQYNLKGSETVYYLTKVIQSVYIITTVNTKLQELMHRFDLSSYNEMYVGYLKSNTTINSTFEGIINNALESLIQFAAKLLVKDFLELKQAQDTMNEYYDKINIVTVALYNVVYNIEDIELIINNNREVIIELLSNNEMTVEVLSHDNNADDNSKYEFDNLGLEYQSEMHTSLKYTEKKMEIISYKSIRELDNDIVAIINDLFGVNYCFPYFLFWKYIAQLKQMQSNQLII